MAALDDFLALNDELAALARAKIPLELGLRGLSVNVSGRLKRLEDRVAARLEEGCSLPEAVREAGALVSPTYTAVIEAALAADRLPEALEAVVQFGRTVQDLQRRIVQALIYPALVAVLAYLFFCLFVSFEVPALLSTQRVFRFDPGVVFPILEWLYRTSPIWMLWTPPLVLLTLFVLAQLSAGVSGQSRSVVDAGWSGLWRCTWVPGVARTYADLDCANTAGLLALLLEHGLPLPRALRLTGAATHSFRLQRACTELANGVEEGRDLRELVRAQHTWPPLFAELLTAGAADSQLPAALRQASVAYGRRAQRRADWIRKFVPVLLTFVGGGTITLLYALALFAPLRWLLLQLGAP